MKQGIRGRPKSSSWCGSLLALGVVILLGVFVGRHRQLFQDRIHFDSIHATRPARTVTHEQHKEHAAQPTDSPQLSRKKDVRTPMEPDRRQPEGSRVGVDATKVTPVLVPSILRKQQSPSTNCSQWTPPLQLGTRGERWKSVAGSETTPVTLSPVLLSQLAGYARKVHGKLEERNKKLWSPYLKAEAVELPETSCFPKFPECAVFARTDVQQEILLQFHEHSLSDTNRYQGMAVSSLSMTNAWEVVRKKILPQVNGVSGSVGAAARAALFMQRKCCIEHGELYAALSYVLERFQKAKVESWLTAGSLLGSLREQGTLIAWDTDIDLCIRPEDEAQVSKLLSDAGKKAEMNFYKEYKKDHAHGRILGVVYGTSSYRHEEASRVEVWVRQESRKMQRAALTFPVVGCELYDLRGVKCPKESIKILEHGYGPNWCRPCKHKTSSCKDVVLTNSSAKVPLK